MPKPRIEYRAHNGYDTKSASDEAADATGPAGDSMTVQAMAEDADINVLMRRYGITGQLPDTPKIPMYGDFTDVKDYRTALEAVRRAHEGFMEIPAELRARWDNDPQKLLEYAADPANQEEMIKFGLAKRRPEPVISHDTKAIVDAIAQGARPPTENPAKA